MRFLVLILVITGCSKLSKPTHDRSLLKERELSTACYRTLKPDLYGTKDRCDFVPYDEVCPCAELDRYEKKYNKYPLTTTKEGATYLNKCYSNKLYGPNHIMVFQEMTEEDNVNESMRRFQFKRTIYEITCDAFNPDKCITSKHSDGWNSYSHTDFILKDEHYKQVKCPSNISQKPMCLNKFKACKKAVATLRKDNALKLSKEALANITVKTCTETLNTCLEDHMENL